MNKHTHKKIDGTAFPYDLQATQQWFGSIIAQPLAKQDRIKKHSPHGFLIEEEAAHYVVPSPTLKPHQRMQIYNQQYWWRLLNALQENFPMVVRFFGAQAFNEKIAVPYLLRFPPNHWSLSTLGERLPSWIKEFYRKPDQSLIFNSAILDWAFSASFIAKQYPPLDLARFVNENFENLLSCKLYLQPSIHLLTWEYNLLSFRESFLKENVEFWMRHPFPKLLKGETYRFILYRNANNKIAWRSLSAGEFIFLECFKDGSSIENACEFLETQDESIYNEIETHFQKWIQEWTHAGWLCLNDNYNSNDRIT